MNSDDQQPRTTAEAYRHYAATLHDIADKLATLADRDVLGNLYMHLTIQPGSSGDSDADKVATIDALGQALIDTAGTTRAMSGGSYHHEAKGFVGGGFRDGVSVSVYTSVTPPEQRALQDEIERLRAERDALLAERNPAQANGEPVGGEA